MLQGRKACSHLLGLQLERLLLHLPRDEVRHIMPGILSIHALARLNLQAAALNRLPRPSHMPASSAVTKSCKSCSTCKAQGYWALGCHEQPSNHISVQPVGWWGVKICLA